ncbi:MAG: serine/threonine-protein kinase [Gemmatimonadaceae bacterium]|nr:serine/threonine-protein kinase [Gemmatimonadaceae bacterium]
MSVPDALAAALADRYTLERELGQGGMATVYLATDVRHNRRVAIKVLHQEVGSAVGVERFLKEIQLTAALQHPHILPLFDSGVAGDRVFYVMPFVEGETLRARLDREQQLPVADALRLTQEVASALSYAHQRGIVHRDIKPENILLQGGQALVADFGIALAATQAGGARLTQTGISLGTPQYMSPEQAMGERTIDARTDLFALGAVAYEMLSGEPPFSGPSVQAIVSKVLTSQPVPVDELRRNVPDAAAAAIMSALEKLPADRPASAEQFVQMLSGATPAPVGRTSGPRRAAPVVSPARRVIPWAAGITAGIALGAGLMAWRGPTRSAAAEATGGPVRFVIGAPDSLELMAVCCGRMFAVSPDGRAVVYQARASIADSGVAAPPLRLFVREMGSLQPIPLAGTEGAAALSISPDGTELAFVAAQKLMRIPLRGGAVSTVAALPPGFIGGTTWRDADHIVVADQYVLFEANARNGQLRALLRSDSLGQQMTSPHALPGGAILFTYSSSDALPVVHVLPADGGAARRVMFGATPMYVARWRALVVNRFGNLLAFPFDAAKVDTLGAGVQIAEGVTLRSPIVAHAEYDVSASGALVVTRREEGQLSGWRPSSRATLHQGDTNTLLVPPANDLVVYLLRFAPQADKLLMSARGTASEGTLYVKDMARGAWTRITNEEHASVADGNDTSDSVVYTLSRTNQLRVRSADGSGAFRDLGAVSGWRRIDNISVRGDWIVISGSSGGAGAASVDLAIVRRDSALRAVPYANSPADEDEPALSPDGRWLAYTSNVSGRNEIYVSPFPVATSRVTVTSDGGQQAHWSADGRTLSYSRPDGAYVSLTFTPGPQPVLGAPQVIYRRASARFWTIDPKGARIVTIDNTTLLKLKGLELVLDFAPKF